MTDQLLPHDPDAERCVIAAMMQCGDDRVTFSRIRRQLWPAAFMLADNTILFRAMVHMADAGESIDSVTLRARLKERGLFEEIGGRAYIATLLNSLPTYTHGPHYAGIVANLARKRDAIGVADEMRRALIDPHGDASGAEVIQRAVAKLWQSAAAGRDLQIWKLADALTRFAESRASGKKSVALETGIEDLDREYRGILTFGGYTLLAARPSMGKSTMVRWMLKELAQAGTPVGLIAVEENEDKIAGNVLSAQTGIENSHLAYGTLTRADWGSVTDGIAKLNDAPFYGIDTALTLPDVLTAAEMLVTQYGCKVVAVDHIHLIDHGRAENRNQQLSEISGALKSFFKRTGVVGLVAAQLSRPSKDSVPQPPRLTDLRDTGSLEEHADAVLMIHRRDYYFRGRDNYTPDGLAQVFIPKNRNGCVGEIVLKADLRYQRFQPISTAPVDTPFDHAHTHRGNYDPFENDE